VSVYLFVVVRDKEEFSARKLEIENLMKTLTDSFEEMQLVKGSAYHVLIMRLHLTMHRTYWAIVLLGYYWNYMWGVVGMALLII